MRCRQRWWITEGFVLNSLDDGLRTNLGTSAREVIFFCKIANLPDLSVGALTAPTAFSEKSTLKHYCLVRHSPVFITGLFPGGFDPSYLSFTNVCPAMVVCCFSSRVIWPVSCTLRVVTASSCSSGMLCVSASLVTRSCFLECDGCGIWRIIIVTLLCFPRWAVRCSSSCLSVCASLSTSALCYPGRPQIVFELSFRRLE